MASALDPFGEGETTYQEELRAKLPELKETDEDAWLDALKKLGEPEHAIRR